MQHVKRHLRLILLTGIAVGLAIILLATDSSRPAVITQKSPIQPTAQEEEAPEKKPAPYEFPAGGRELFPNYRLVALYGTPGTPVLGSLGEQSAEKAVERIQKLAKQYQPHTKEHVYPAFEIITTVASAGPTHNKDYSNELEINKIKPWVDIARDAGVYVILDLQPGLTDFLAQAKIYEELLKEPHVGLALDPEWRLKPGQKHMKQIGSVTAKEINQTAEWLADLTKSHDLPQKLFLIHQFKLSMIDGRETLDTSSPELAWLIQMDGLGAQPVKQETWRTIRADAPENIYFGWKNFIDEDKPMLNPKQTMQVKPKPYYVSYQ